MKDKKEIIKSIVIIIVILIVIIYYFFVREEEYEEIVENQTITSNTNIQENSDNIEKEKIKVYVIGEVNKPGVVELEEGARLEDAIILAGGTTSNSDLSKINLAYMLEDGQKIYIPSINENLETDYITSQNSEGIIEENSGDNDSKININTADLNKLCELPGVGEALAGKIIDYRQINGKFKSIEDLKNVNGIGDKKYESLKEYICIK